MPRDLFVNNRPRLGSANKSRNCTYNTTVGRSFALDYSGPLVAGKHQARIIYFNLEGNYFASTDLSGCYYRRLTQKIDGNAPITITFDQSNLYWKNDSSGTVYRSAIFDTFGMANINHSTESIHFDSAQINSVISYNRLNQPNPSEPACLIPHNLKTQVHLEDNTAYSLTLRVEVSQNQNSATSWTELCGDLSVASLRYRIH